MASAILAIVFCLASLNTGACDRELAGHTEPLGDPSSDDRTVSVGHWDVIVVEINGRKLDGEIAAMLQVAYRENGSWALLFKGLPLAEGTSSIDPEASPKSFEMETVTGGETMPRTFLGIYRIDGDSRQLCFVEDGAPRPDTFTAARGSGRVLVTLKRTARTPTSRSLGAPHDCHYPLRVWHRDDDVGGACCLVAFGLVSPALPLNTVLSSSAWKK